MTSIRTKSPVSGWLQHLEKALGLAAEILGVGLEAMPLPPEVLHRRMVDLARFRDRRASERSAVSGAEFASG
jgi:hypothetical protein